MSCPACGTYRSQVRDGKTAAGSQRMRCQACGKRYTPEPKAHGYDLSTRATAMRMVADGINLRRAERLLQVHHTTILRWKRQAAARLPETPPQPQMTDEIELDELYTFVTQKKNRYYLLTSVDRMTHTILGWDLTTERTAEQIQALVDRLPPARVYYSDGLEAYQDVVYVPGHHTVSIGKRDTYTVEGCNADIRHYIAVLARKTRCVARSADSLRDTLRIMIAAYNRQQLHRFRYPKYRRSLSDFVSP